MKKYLKTEPVENHDYQYDLENELSSVVSATECTGLIQVPPQDEEEAAAYAEIYTVPKNDRIFNK